MNKDVEKNINKLDPLQKKIMEKLRKLIQKSAPHAQELMSYGVPAFKLDRNLVLYSAFKNHIGLYPGPEIIEKFKNELINYETSKGTIKFNLDKSIPYDLIIKIVKYKFNIKK